MPFSNYIYEYYDGISSGNITVGKWVRLLYEYIVKGLQEGLFTFNAKKANKAIRFIENFCHHCEGRTDLLKLELWQPPFPLCSGSSKRTERASFVKCLL